MIDSHAYILSISNPISNIFSEIDIELTKKYKFSFESTLFEELLNEEEENKIFFNLYEWLQNKDNDEEIGKKDIQIKNELIKSPKELNGKKKNRGRPRKIKNSDRPIHGKNNFDNIERKLQVHFLTFLIDFCNDALRKEYENLPFTFKHINNKSKITVNLKHTNNLKNSSIKDILNLEISAKYKTFNKLENLNLLSKIEGTWLDRLFQTNYLKSFKWYYNEGKYLGKVIFEDKEIILSENTKTFYHLIENNPDLRQKIIDTAKNVYLNDYDICGSPFSTRIISFDEENEDVK